jgi:hypothetical protein
MSGLTAYPNPSTGMVCVQHETLDETIKRIVLTDVKGKVMKTLENTHELDLWECE